MKTVIEMAREASDPDKVDPWDEQSGLCVLTQAELERFAELVRADEREARAQFFDNISSLPSSNPNRYRYQCTRCDYIISTLLKEKT
jgi:hypothetical protein